MPSKAEKLRETLSRPDVREKINRSRRLRSEAINNTKKLRRRRIKGEVSSLSAAIANMCRECMGFESDEYPSLAAKVKDCPCVQCHLWPWRSGKLNTDGEEELW